MVEESIARWLSLYSNFAPKEDNNFIIISTSFKLGIFPMVLVLPLITVAAKIGKTEFFAPVISTSPNNLFPPLIIYFSILPPPLCINFIYLILCIMVKVVTIIGLSYQ